MGYGAEQGTAVRALNTNGPGRNRIAFGELDVLEKSLAELDMAISETEEFFGPVLHSAAPGTVDRAEAEGPHSDLVGRIINLRCSLQALVRRLRDINSRAEV